MSGPRSAPERVSLARALAADGADAFRSRHASRIDRTSRDLSDAVPAASAAGVEPALVILGGILRLVRDLDAERATEIDAERRGERLSLATTLEAEIAAVIRRVSERPPVR